MLGQHSSKGATYYVSCVNALSIKERSQPVGHCIQTAERWVIRHVEAKRWRQELSILERELSNPKRSS
jgi:hypothetical protein